MENGRRDEVPSKDPPIAAGPLMNGGTHSDALALGARGKDLGGALGDQLPGCADVALLREAAADGHARNVAAAQLCVDQEGLATLIHSL